PRAERPYYRTSCGTQGKGNHPRCGSRKTVLGSPGRPAAVAVGQPATRRLHARRRPAAGPTRDMAGRQYGQCLAFLSKGQETDRPGADATASALIRAKADNIQDGDFASLDAYQIIRAQVVQNARKMFRCQVQA